MNHPKPAFFEDIALPEMAETASGKPWSLRDADLREVSMMVQQLGLDPQIARILAARGVLAAGADAYLSPRLRDALPDPYVLKDMREAAERIAEAVLNNEMIGVFGDYDVDGTTASAVLFRYFKSLGVEIPVYLPDRQTEGYGPSSDAFRALTAKGAKIIITVDCGASAHEPIAEIVKEGAEVIVLDHHQMSAPPPVSAFATVNPNRPDDTSGLHNLSAAGVAFLSVVAISRRLREVGYFNDRPEPDLMSLLDLTALGLVCDVMAMNGLTRIIVSQGLKILDANGNIGLKALAAQAGAKAPSTPYHLGFLLGPRINAAGRIGHARLALELLTTADAQRARALAEKLHMLNAERQEIEAAVQADALQQIERDHLDQDDVIVVAGEGWHSGVIGIVAGRIKEKFDKPTIVIGIDGGANGGVGKGSGRSIGGVDLGSAITSAREAGLLIAGGGHAMAAGLTVSQEAIGQLRQRLNEDLSQDVQLARASRKFEVDAVVDGGAVSRSFADLVARAGPYGVGNPEPVFVLGDVRPTYVKVVGERHLSMSLEDRSGRKVRAIAFRAEGERLGEILRGPGRLHVAGKIRADDWRGGDAGQFQIEDAAPVAARG